MKQAKVITEIEMKKLLSSLKDAPFGVRDRMAVMLSHYAGFRACEIALLQLGDVFDIMGRPKERITLRASTTKSGEARSVFVNVRLAKELARFGSDIPKPMKMDSPLLQSYRNHPFSANGMCQLFREIYGRAGIDGASSHSGRRWFITRLANKKVNVRAIMALAGHKNLSTTQRYIDVNDDILRQAVRRL